MHTYCRFNGIGIIPWGPLDGGNLARSVGTSTTRNRMYQKMSFSFDPSNSDRGIIDQVETLAKERKVSMAKVSLA